MSYREIAHGPERRFEITGGLRRGYGEGRHSMIEDVIAAHHRWQEEHGEILGCCVTLTYISYGWPDHDDGIRSDDEVGFVLSGTINVLYDWALGDHDAKARVESLAAFLAKHLGQERIYYAFMGFSYILEREKEEEP